MKVINLKVINMKVINMKVINMKVINLYLEINQKSELWPCSASAFSVI